jgi:hypothetical protein
MGRCVRNPEQFASLHGVPRVQIWPEGFNIAKMTNYLLGFADLGVPNPARIRYSGGHVDPTLQIREAS